VFLAFLVDSFGPRANGRIVCIKFGHATRPRERIDQFAIPLHSGKANACGCGVITSDTQNPGPIVKVVAQYDMLMTQKYMVNGQRKITINLYNVINLGPGFPGTVQCGTVWRLSNRRNATFTFSISTRGFSISAALTLMCTACCLGMSGFRC
jgi:hypothetical protein